MSNTFEITSADLEQLPLRSIVALGYLSVRRVRGDFVVPSYVPNPRRFHKAVDTDLAYVRQFADGHPIDLKFALQRTRAAFDAEQAGHDIIYGHGPYAGLGPVSLQHASPETRRAAVVAEAVGTLAAAVYHFSFSVLSGVDLGAVKSIGFPVDQKGWAANGVKWTMEALAKCEPSRAEYDRLLQAARSSSSAYPALGEPVNLEI